MRIRSRLGSGTTVVVRLPVDRNRIRTKASRNLLPEA